ncbi:MAG: glycosyltransferase 87 family protein, partial [Rhodothermales bacterium]|nr:glycosyltransferase 87 family protein [Rhodothermales bacterium]
MRSSLSEVFALWRSRPALGVLGVLAAVALPFVPVYLTLRVLLPVWRGDVPGHVDFSVYYDAAGRFLADPLSLYPAVTGFLYPPPAVLAYVPFRALGLTAAAATMTLLNAVLAVLVVRLALRLYARWRGEPAAPLRATAYLLGLASGPVFQSLRFAQASVVVCV